MSKQSLLLVPALGAMALLALLPAACSTTGHEATATPSASATNTPTLTTPTPFGRTWLSYCDAGRTQADDLFLFQTGTVIYLGGNGYSPSTSYLIATYDTGGQLRATANSTSNGSGQLASSYTVTGAETSGPQWHSAVYTSGSTPSNGYNPSDAGLLISHTFAVMAAGSTVTATATRSGTSTVTVTATATPSATVTATATITSTGTCAPGDNRWIPRPPMSSSRDWPAAAPVTIGGVSGVLAMGGWAPITTAEFYNPVTNSWSGVANMLTARENFGAAPVTIGGASGVLTLGGNDGGYAHFASAEFYNPANNSWTSVASMSTVRDNVAAAPVTVSGVAGVLAVGGGNGGATVYATAEFYNPVTNSWTTVAPMSSVRESEVAIPVTIGGVTGVLAAGGDDYSSYLGTAEFYNPVTNSWSAIASLPAVRDYFAGAPVTIGGITGALVMGGSTYGNSDLATAAFYNPVANSWSAVASMSSPRNGFAAAPMAIGALSGILAMGGFNGSSFVATAEFYCP